MSDTPLWQLSATELSALTRSRDISAEEATRAAVDRMRALNPDLNAVVEDLGDAALARARALDTDGGDRGPLFGVPVTIKVNVDQKGHATTNGLPALKDWIVEEMSPGPSVSSDEEILSHAMAMGGPAYHICGTARMGADEDAVVDPRLRVRGMVGLRVADTSIMPTLVSANTNGPAMMIGLRAARFIAEDNGF